MDNYSDYTVNEFLAYVMIYAANADFVINKSEEQVIIDKVGEETYSKMLSLFKHHNDAQTVEFIQELKKIYITDNKNEQLLSLVKKVFLADEYFSASEKALYNAIARL